VTRQTTKRVKSVGRTQTETEGFAVNTREGLQEIPDELRTAGHDPEKIDERLAAKTAETAQANAEQEELKRKLKAATVKVERLNRELDLMASGYLDVGISAVGKGSDEAKNLQRIRSRIRKPAGQDSSVQGAPAPEAAS
jgi:uncharacterized protein (UPF0335 family)